MKPFQLILASALLELAACGGTSGSAALPLPVSAQFPIDGLVDLSALTGVQTAFLEFSDALGTGAPTGKLVTLRWGVANDDRDLYVALEWNDASHDHSFDATLGPTDFDGVKLLFDVNGDGLWQAGEDSKTVVAASVGSQFVDEHAAAGNATDAVGDGAGRITWDSPSGLYTAEFLIPMSQDAQGQDGDLSPQTRLNIVLFDHVQLAAGTGNATALDPAATLGADTSGWDSAGIVPAGPHAHPQLPSDLTGLIAFLSDHENPQGDVYTFDPATRVTTRVTNSPLFKDGVSLSHDRTRIAFFGALDQTDFASYEIWTVNTDGSGLTQVTNNTWLDGHPAWSPDDTRIAYASFETGLSRIKTMTATGTPIAVLTPPGFQDNDPEYLPDGRIVFKTDRFQAQPQVQIALMNEDGTGLQQLTFSSGVSDHDPTGGDGWIFFERFPKGTFYGTDVEAGFIGWPIVEVRQDGTGEHLLVDDGDINWLPVLDPSSRYLIQIRTAGYSEARLVDRNGSSLGRLIPDVTRITYLDWK